MVTPTGFWHQIPVCPHLGQGRYIPGTLLCLKAVHPLKSDFPSLPPLKYPLPASKLVVLTS